MLAGSLAAGVLKRPSFGASCRRARIGAGAEIGEQIGEAARGRARIGRGDQRELGVGDGGEAVFPLQRAVVGQQRHIGRMLIPRPAETAAWIPVKFGLV